MAFAETAVAVAFPEATAGCTEAAVAFSRGGSGLHRGGRELTEARSLIIQRSGGQSVPASTLLRKQARCSGVGPSLRSAWRCKAVP